MNNKIYHQLPEDLTSAQVISPKGFADRGVVRAYNHMSNLVFFPCDTALHIDGSDALSLAGSENTEATEKEIKDFVLEYSYPIETANRIANEINKA